MSVLHAHLPNTILYSYGHLLVITGYFYGVSSVLITGIWGQNSSSSKTGNGEVPVPSQSIPMFHNVGIIPMCVGFKEFRLTSGGSVSITMCVRRGVPLGAGEIVMFDTSSA